MAIENEMLFGKINELAGRSCPAILSFIDDSGSVFAILVKDFKISKENIDLKKPKSLHHKFGKNEVVGLCWCDYGLNKNTGRMDGGTMEHYTLWGPANELGGNIIRVVPDTKFHSSFEQKFDDPAYNMKMIQNADKIRAKYGLGNAYDLKGLV